jgi:hypothetical protein
MRVLLVFGLFLLLSGAPALAQGIDSAYLLTGIVYDESFHPLPASHVINMVSHQGDVTDSLGIFSLRVHSTDTLLIRNIAFRDTLVSAETVAMHPQIRLHQRYYTLQEATIFEWGSTYEDFSNAMIRMPNQQTLGESMGLPRQDPDYVPVEMDPKAVKSPLMLITAPVSFFYYNFNKQAKSARKVYWLNKNRQKIELFEQIISGENLSSITGLTGNELMEFQAYLNQNLKCDFNCTEFQIYSEIYALWDLYRKQKN